MYTIATLYALRARLGLAPTDTADDTRLLKALCAAAAAIERAAGRHFIPRFAAVRHHFNTPRMLLLDDDLLELMALTNGDGSSLNPAEVLRLPQYSPAGTLRLIGGSAFFYDDTPVAAITVSGLWGWHDRWERAWLPSGDTVQNNPLSSSATSLTVTDADGADTAGESPRFQVGHLLRIADEFLRVLAVNTTANILTVQRGVNGTTAAAHAQFTPIDRYQPPEDVAALALRWAAWLYREPDSATFAAAPDNLRQALSPFRRESVKAIS